MMKNPDRYPGEYQSMRGSLPKTRDLAPYDHTRGKVGWARWRSNKKTWTHRYRRHVLDQEAIQASNDGV